ncbi:two-component system response regulator [Magnetofaba australis]|uniref:Putative response regulator receiver modulated diguanylate cyclase/phosphodiesterase with PAS/PAC sensor n=1 Tax=Magnetofaba australis IT-1 TaxID=1434232 RepID=A0A1Y2K1M8_9PROT|nr:EAL domain-containing protein [Magnetofaba australis]OSM00211.1 putative response regulator receiver modulated diguanylate cyclase/phosphodiesterase with PAS/PAC sensor [Magnetofaba australis IT-1]
MKILFVDDMTTVQMLYGQLLYDQGHQVILASSLTEALTLAREHRPPLAIVDFHMPEGNGAELTRALLAQPETANTLVLMHSQARDVVKQSLEAGAIDLIYKDDPHEVFLMRVAAVTHFIQTQAEQQRREAAARKREMEALERARAVEERARVELEERVAERTAELTQSNRQLTEEIEKRAHAETNLRLAHMVFQNTAEAIILTDPTGAIIDVNPAFSAISGYTREEAIGANPRDFKSGRHDDNFYAKMWNSVLSKGHWQGEVWDRRKNGEIYPKRLTINVVRDASNRIEHFVGIFSDISEDKATEMKLEQLAYYDPLTQLPNRMLFRDRLEHEFYSARRHKSRFAVCFIDLDRFKQVNDTLGHSAGDELLQHVAQRLEGCVRATDTVARLGGDEFTMILTEVGVSSDSVAHVAEKVLIELQKPMHIKGQEIFVGASIGISLFPENGEDFDTLTKNADVAMYQAKARGRGNFVFFSEDMNTRARERLMLESKLKKAIENEELSVFYQPKMEMYGGRLVGMEALARWVTRDGEEIPPTRFIPIAEETGLVGPLGDFVMRRAARDCKRWLDMGHPLRVAVNLSAREFLDPLLPERVDAILAEAQLPGEHFEIEITESMMMQDVEQAVHVLQELRARNITIAMDDFGTGYSSLSYLKQFPIHTLKIDRAFVKEAPDDPNDVAIVAAVLSVARAMDLKVVAEGVEESRQLALLRDHGCDELQGYLYAKPLNTDDFTQFLLHANAHGARQLQNLPASRFSA